MRGHLTMTFRLPIELEKICYDQVQSTAYALSVNSHLYSMNLEALQTYWRNNNEERGRNVRRKMKQHFGHPCLPRQEFSGITRL